MKATRTLPNDARPTSTEKTAKLKRVRNLWSNLGNAPWKGDIEPLELQQYLGRTLFCLKENLGHLYERQKDEHSEEAKVIQRSLKEIELCSLIAEMILVEP